MIKRKVGRKPKKEVKKNSKITKKIGRKLTYETKIKPFLDQITESIIEGRKLNTIIKDLGVSPAMFYEHINKQQEFLEAIEAGRAKQAIKTQQALEKRINGFRYKETVKKYVIDDETGLRKLIVEEIRGKEVIPDVAAIVHSQKYNYRRSPTPGVINQIYDLAEKEEWDVFRQMKEFERRGFMIPQSLLVQVQAKIEIEKASGNDTGIAVVPAQMEESEWEKELQKAGE